MLRTSASGEPRKTPEMGRKGRKEGVAEKQNYPEDIAFHLAERIIALLRESGATLEQSQAAIQTVGAVLPLAEFTSRTRQSFFLRP